MPTLMDRVTEALQVLSGRGRTLPAEPVEVMRAIETVARSAPVEFAAEVEKRTSASFVGGASASGFIAKLVQGSTLPRRGVIESLAAYEAIPSFRRTVGRVATAVASVPWRLFATSRNAKSLVRELEALRVVDASLAAKALKERGKLVRRATERGDLRELTAHPFVRFLEQPNPEHTGRAFRELCQVWLDITGEAFWLDVEQLGRKDGEVWPLPPQWITHTPDSLDPTFHVSAGFYNARHDDDQVSWLRHLSPLDPYGRGSGIGRTLGDELDTSEHAAKHIAAYFNNRAIPDLWISLEDAEGDQLKQWETDYDNKMRTQGRANRIFLTNSKAQVKELAATFKDMTLVELRKHTASEVQRTYGVPPEIVGDVNESKRSTIEAAAYIMAVFVMIPRLEFQREHYQTQLLPRYPQSDRLVALYDDPIPPDSEAQGKTREQFPWAFSADDAREAAGAEPLGEAGGGGVHAVPSDSTLVLGLAGIGKDEETEEDAAAALAVEPKALVDAMESFALIGDVDAYNLARGRYFAALGETAPAPLTLEDIKPEPPDMGADAKPGARSREGSDDPEDDSRRSGRLIRRITETDLERAIDALDPIPLRMEIGAQHRAVVDDFGRQMMISLGATASFSMLSPLVVEFLQSSSLDRIDMINATTREQLRDELTQGVLEGEGIPALSKRVALVMGHAKNFRSERIARTEVLRASNFARWQGMAQVGLITQRRWLSTKDGRTRDAHVRLDGQIALINEPFRIDGAEAMYPGAFGRPELDVNCRCTTLPIINDAEAEPVGGGGGELVDIGGALVDAASAHRLLTKDATADDLRIAYATYRRRAVRWEVSVAKASRRAFAAQQRRVIRVLTAAAASEAA